MRVDLTLNLYNSSLYSLHSVRDLSSRTGQTWAAHSRLHHRLLDLHTHRPSHRLTLLYSIRSTILPNHPVIPWPPLPTQHSCALAIVRHKSLTRSRKEKLIMAGNPSGPYEGQSRGEVQGVPAFIVGLTTGHSWQDPRNTTRPVSHSLPLTASTPSGGGALEDRGTSIVRSTWRAASHPHCTITTHLHNCVYSSTDWKFIYPTVHNATIFKQNIYS